MRKSFEHIALKVMGRGLLIYDRRCGTLLGEIMNHKVFWFDSYDHSDILIHLREVYDPKLVEGN